MSARKLTRIIPSQVTSDGAGVRLRRSLGSRADSRVDPFLMLDEFYSDNPDDYLAGFPNHPHRGFETVTYMLAGHMRHEDHLGNRGDLGPGDVQWMTAGRGIIHSEMPQQKEGRMRGFQLWINLPAREKMKPAGYRDLRADEIPQWTSPDGATVKAIAGTVAVGGQNLQGPINDPAQRLSTDPLYLDVRLPASVGLEIPVTADHNALLYVFDGSLNVAAAGSNEELPAHHAGLLGRGDVVSLKAGPLGAGLLVLAARPLNEPVVQYGPFVMNTREEIEQALDDYRTGRLTA